MRTASNLAALLALTLTGCKATHELVECRDAVSVDLEAAASVAVFGATGVPGEYRFAGQEGVASCVVKSGGVLGSSAPECTRSSHDVVFPWKVDKVLMIPGVGDEVLMTFGDERVLTLSSDAGSWDDLSSGGETEFTLTGESWQRWEAAMRERFRREINDYGSAYSERCSDRSVRKGRVFDVKVVPPRIRASRSRLTIAFEDVQLAGEFLVSRWHLSPTPRPTEGLGLPLSDREAYLRIPAWVALIALAGVAQNQ